MRLTPASFAAWIALPCCRTPSAPIAVPDTISTCSAPSNACRKLAGSAKSPWHTRTPRCFRSSALPGSRVLTPTCSVGSFSSKPFTTCLPKFPVAPVTTITVVSFCVGEWFCSLAQLNDACRRLLMSRMRKVAAPEGISGLACRYIATTAFTGTNESRQPNNPIVRDRQNGFTRSPAPHQVCDTFRSTKPPRSLLLLHRRRAVRLFSGLPHPRKHLDFVKLVHGGQLDAAGSLAHAGRCHRGFWLQFVTTDEH